MFIAILTLAIIFGGVAATAALIAGWSFIAALAVYSGTGLLGVLMVVLTMATTSALQNRRATQLQTDAIAGN